jgi:hypothetical protein
VRAHERRLVAALRRAKPTLPPVGDLSPEMIETMLVDIVATFVARWIGPPPKKPCA